MKQETSSTPKILQVFSRYREYGGEEASVFRIGDALQRDFDTGYYLSSNEDILGNGLPATVGGAALSFSNRGAVRELRRYQELGGYDFWLVHNTFPLLSSAVYPLAFELGVPVVQYLHNYRFGCVNGFFLNHGKPCQRCMHGNFLPAFRTACWKDSHLMSGYMGAITARARGLDLFGRIHRWIAVSETQKSEYVAMGVPENRITVIPHFYEPQGDAPTYPGGGDVVFVGRLSVEKGVDRLLKAWRLVGDCGRKLWIVGEGPERSALEKSSRELGLGNVVFTGFLQQEELGAIWSKAACSVVPSVWKEPFGMVVLEAWAKRRPVVAHRIGSLAEMISDGIDGLLASPDSPGELAGALLSILQDPAKGRAMGEAGLKKLGDRYSETQWRERIRPVFGMAPGTGNPSNQRV